MLKCVKSCYRSVNEYYVLELAVFALCLQLPKTFFEMAEYQWLTKFVVGLTFVRKFFIIHTAQSDLSFVILKHKFAWQ